MAIKQAGLFLFLIILCFNVFAVNDSLVYSKEANAFIFTGAGSGNFFGEFYKEPLEDGGMR